MMHAPPAERRLVFTARNVFDRRIDGRTSSSDIRFEQRVLIDKGESVLSKARCEHQRVVLPQATALVKYAGRLIERSRIFRFQRPVNSAFYNGRRQRKSKQTRALDALEGALEGECHWLWRGVVARAR